MSKPSWGDMPSWANWLAQDRDGEWWVYESKPKITGDSAEWNVIKGDYRQVYPKFDNWKNSLEERPND